MNIIPFNARLPSAVGSWSFEESPSCIRIQCGCNVWLEIRTLSYIHLPSFSMKYIQKRNLHLRYHHLRTHCPFPVCTFFVSLPPFIFWAFFNITIYFTESFYVTLACLKVYFTIIDNLPFVSYIIKCMVNGLKIVKLDRQLQGDHIS